MLSVYIRAIIIIYKWSVVKMQLDNMSQYT